MSADNQAITPLADTGVKTSGKGIILFGLIMILFLFVTGGAWAYYTTLSGAVIAPGQVAVLGKPKTIQHLDGGIVAEINIADGDRVETGQVLVRLNDTLLRSNLKIYENRLIEGIAQRARLITERDEATTIKWEDDLLTLLNVVDDPAVKDGQQKLFQARKETRLGQIAQLREKIAQFQNQKQGIQALQASKIKQVAMMDDELEGMRILKKKKLTTKSQLMVVERQKEDLVGQNAEHGAELARIQNSIGETEIQILQIDREFRQSVLTELRQIEREVNEMTQQLYATVEQLKRIEIKSPIAGIIHELSVFTIGGVIGPGAPVTQIIPQDDLFEIEANIEPQFVDELYPGQEATVRFSAFNQRSTPELFGHVKGVSANVVMNEQTGAAFYKVRISVGEKELFRLNGQTLIPGMPVEAFVKTKDRTALNYLTKPLMDQINRAFREE